MDNGMTQEEFDLTRSFLTKYILHFAVTTSQRLGYAMDDRFYGIGGDGHLARFAEMLLELTLDDVNAAIREHLQYENLKIAIVTGDAEGLRAAIVADTPSPIEYAQEMPEEVLAEDEEISTLAAGRSATIGSTRCRWRVCFRVGGSPHLHQYPVAVAGALAPCLADMRGKNPDMNLVGFVRTLGVNTESSRNPDKKSRQLVGHRSMGAELQFRRESRHCGELRKARSQTSIHCHRPFFQEHSDR